jgi:thiamine-monophosphate kinase
MMISNYQKPAGRPAVYHALMDGEDFELLFAVSPREAAHVPARIRSCPVTRIGSVVSPGQGVEVQSADGNIRRLLPKGFRHF